MTADERESLCKLRGGDEAAFTELVGRHHASMVRVARGYVRSAEIAEEVAQDAWLGALRQGLSSTEACDILDISEVNQRVLLHRARTRVCDELEKEIAG